MKPATIIGIVLIILGIIGFAMGGFQFTHEKKDVNMGPVQISHKTKETFPISPVLSTIALVAGVGLVMWVRRAVRFDFFTARGCGRKRFYLR